MRANPTKNSPHPVVSRPGGFVSLVSFRGGSQNGDNVSRDRRGRVHRFTLGGSPHGRRAQRSRARRPLHGVGSEPRAHLPCTGVDPRKCDRGFRGGGSAVAGCDTVFHLAALASVAKSVEEPLASHAACATGGRHSMRPARPSVRQVVYAGSRFSADYGGLRSLTPRARTRDTPLSRSLTLRRREAGEASSTRRHSPTPTVWKPCGSASSTCSDRDSVLTAHTPG